MQFTWPRVAEPEKQIFENLKSKSDNNEALRQKRLIKFSQILGNTSQSGECSGVKCVPVKPSNCHAIIPPGGCCPVCGK